MATPLPKPPHKILMTGIRGRDGASPIFTLMDEKCREALNVDWYRSSLGRKRPGATSLSLTGGTGQTGQISTVYSFVPQAVQANREMWSIDDAATPRWKRLAGGTAWADVTVSDAVLDHAEEITAVYFNRKFFWAYHSNVDRSHVWDGSTFRRTGLAAAGAPAIANLGGGTYAATLRYYKVRWVVMSGSVVTLAGELSSAVSFTPSGGGASAQVTQPTPPGEGETHWEIYGSPDGSSYFRLSQVAVGTTTYADSTVPSAYTGVAPPAVGSFLTPHSCKYMVADKKRLVSAGAHNPSASNVFTKSTRFSWTAPLGATDNGDDERVSNTSSIKNYDDIEEDINGLGGPINGAIYVFSYNGAWISFNNGLDVSPYITQKLSGALGTIHHKTIIVAEDETGDACLYWLSPVGPVRHGQGGFSHCHEDVDDIWETVNLSATYPPHGVFHRDIHQIWWFVATGSSNECDTRIVFDTRLGRVTEVAGVISVRNGWAKHTGADCAARCSCMMSRTIGASMSVTLAPYIGKTTTTAIWKCDTGTTANGTPFQSYIKSKAYCPWGLNNRGGMAEEAVLAAAVSTGVTITATTIRDRGTESLTSTASLTADSTETGVIRRLEGSRFADAKTIEFQVGDSIAVDASWNLDALIAAVDVDGVV